MYSSWKEAHWGGVGWGGVRELGRESVLPFFFFSWPYPIPEIMLSIDKGIIRNLLL